MVIKRIEHTAFIVRNLEEAIAFYEDKLNFELRMTGNTGTRKIAFIFVKGNPGSEIELIEELTDIAAPEENGIIDHLAFAVDNIDEAIKELKSKRVQFLTDEPRATATGGKMIFFKGLNDELLQLIEK